MPTPPSDAITGAGPLFDNSSATSAAFASVELPLSAPARRVQYTLTSAERAKAPAVLDVAGLGGRHDVEGHRPAGG